MVLRHKAGMIATYVGYERLSRPVPRTRIGTYLDLLCLSKPVFSSAAWEIAGGNDCKVALRDGTAHRKTAC